jgi:predicted RNase H-like HicB family nuclease
MSWAERLTRYELAGTRRATGRNETPWGTDVRQVVIYPGEDGYWVAECLSLPGCISQGGTKEEAVTNIKAAIQAYIAALSEDGLPVPEEHFSSLLLAV